MRTQLQKEMDYLLNHYGVLATAHAFYDALDTYLITQQRGRPLIQNFEKAREAASRLRHELQEAGFDYL